MDSESTKQVKQPLDRYDSSYEGTRAIAAALDRKETTITIKGAIKNGAQASVKQGIAKTQSGYDIPIVVKRDDGNLSVAREIDITNIIKNHPDYPKKASFFTLPVFQNPRDSGMGFYMLEKKTNLEECSNFIRKQLNASDSSQSEAAASYLFEKGIKKLVTGLEFLDNTFQDKDRLDHSGITHLDIKPDNILINQKGNWSLADFGCANFCDQPIQQTGALTFQSPELLRDAEKYHEGAVFSELGKSDIWSLGATLRYLETGKYVIAPPLETNKTNDFFSINCQGQEDRKQKAINYLKNVTSEKKNDDPLHNPSDLTQKEILSHLTSTMLLPREQRYTIQELKKIVDSISPYFSTDNEQFVNKMLESVKESEKTEEKNILPIHEYINVKATSMAEEFDQTVADLETLLNCYEEETNKLFETSFNFGKSDHTSFFLNNSMTTNSSTSVEQEKEKEKYLWTPLKSNP